MGQRGPTGARGTQCVHLQRLAPQLVITAVEPAVGDGESEGRRAVDEDVQSAQLSRRVRDEIVHLVRYGDAGLRGREFESCAGSLLGQRLDRLEVTVGGQYGSSAFGKEDGACRPDATTCTSHDGNLAVKVQPRRNDRTLT